MPPRHPSPTSQPRWATAAPRPQKRHGRETRLSDTEIAKLSALMQERFKWKDEPRFFQLAGVRAQLEGVDMIIQAPTGAGKTAVAAGPHVWPTSWGKTSIMVCPLLALEDEMVETFKTNFGLKAVAVNSATSTCTDAVVKDLINRVYQIVLISPEMLQSPVFVNRVLRKPAFAKRVLSLIIDEAHCVSHWGAGFRKKYGSLGVIRAFLPRGTPVIAVTATLTARVRRDLHRVLHFPKHGSRFVNIGNDRPNVTIAVRALQHPQNTYADLDFIIPPHVACASDIPKTYVYVDNILVGNEIVDHLSALLAERCPLLASRELIRPYNATMGHDYHHRAMAAFRSNPRCTQSDATLTEADQVIRVLVCTDAAGMGCNISDVDLVVQWKLPKSLSSFVQRAGRAARSSGRQGLAVLLVERSAYSVDLAQPAPAPDLHARDHGKAKPRGGRGGVQGGRARKGALPKDYAYHHGVNRGSSLMTEDSVPTEGTEPGLNVEAEDEGLLVFVQTRKCRRLVWAAAFDSSVQALSPGISCCDICDPSVFDRIRPTSLSSKSKPRMRARGKPDYNAQSSLYKWRKDVRLRDHHNTQLDTSAILDVATIVTLTSHGPLTRAQITTLLKDTWIWWERYGNELCDLVSSLDIVHRPIKKATGSVQKPAGVQAEPTIAGAVQQPSGSVHIHHAVPPSGAPSRPRSPAPEGLVEPAAKRARVEEVAANACRQEVPPPHVFLAAASTPPPLQPPPPPPNPLQFSSQGCPAPPHAPSQGWTPPAHHASAHAPWSSAPATFTTSQPRTPASAPFSTPVQHMPPYYHHPPPTPPLLWQPYSGWSSGFRSQQPSTPTPATSRHMPMPPNYVNSFYGHSAHWQPAMVGYPGPSSSAYPPSMPPNGYSHGTAVSPPSDSENRGALASSRGLNNLP